MTNGVLEFLRLPRGIGAAAFFYQIGTGCRYAIFKLEILPDEQNLQKYVKKTQFTLPFLVNLY